MSRLYDAISKIEAKHHRKDDIPEFSKKKKPPYLLIIISLTFAAVLILSAIIIDKKISRINSRVVVNKTHKKIERHKSEKVNLLSKASDSKISHKKTAAAIKKPSAENSKAGTISHAGQAAAYDNTRSSHRIEKKVNIIKKEQQTELKQYIDKKNVKQTDNTAELLENIAEMDDNAAIEAYKKLIERFPNEVSLYNNLSVRYINKKDYKDALGILKKALKFSNDRDLKINLTIIYIKLGRYKMAKKVIKTVNLGSVNDGAVRAAVENIDDFLDRVKNK